MDRIHLRNYLLGQHPNQVDTWLQNAMNGSVFSPEDFQWWLGLAQGATSRAESSFRIDASAQHLAVMWAKIGVTIYEYLLAQPSNASDCPSLEVSLMALRAFFITKLGIVENDPLLDVEQIVQWFFQDLPYSLQELRRLIEILHEIKSQSLAWRQLLQDKKIIMPQYVFQVEDLRNMRLVKNKLRVLKTLSTEKLLSPAQYEKVCDWLLLWKNLP